MTINKSQSQGFSYVLIDGTVVNFSHGHAYVAPSRATDCMNIKMYQLESQLHPSPMDPLVMVPTMTNVVFEEIVQYM